MVEAENDSVYHMRENNRSQKVGLIGTGFVGSSFAYALMSPF
jgi:hypothetical protein